MATLTSRVFTSNNVDGFNNYVNGYQDVRNNFNSWLNDNSNVHWGDYVRQHPDLYDAYSSESQGQSIWDWGYNHYQQYGRNETRTLPKVVSNPGDINRDGDPTNDMATVLTQQVEGSMDQAANDQDTLAAFGQYHFQRPEVQQNEDRIVPGYSPKIYITPNGVLATSPGLATSKAKTMFDTAIRQVYLSGVGNYKGMLETLANNFGGAGYIIHNEFLNNGSLDAVNTYYKSQVPFWDPNSYGTQPPVGAFDAEYYKKNYPEATAAWEKAVAENDLDIIARYQTLDNFLYQHYTNVGKYQNYRGNEAYDPKFSNDYKEGLTDAEYQIYRDQVLGLGTAEQPSILGTKLSEVITAKDLQEQQMFGALTQDALKQTIDEIKKAKQKESNLALFKGLPGFSEIINVNQTLSQSLLGDSGVGGLLSITQSGTKTEEELAKQLEGITGISTSNSTVYNWQKWFDDVLVKRYQDGLAVQDPVNAENQFQIEREFAAKFVTDYLKPRFDTSRSMDEFASYMDVQQGEQNIFQTQTALDSLRSLADMRAKSYLDSIYKTGQTSPSTFDAEFYFNPIGNETKIDKYATQAQQVAADWEAAKAGDPYWAKEAYRYGLDVNDKAQFARLHYQVKGLTEGYDPAKDLITFQDANNYINTSVIPAVQDAKTAIGDVSFLQFVTPDEFADRLLEGVDPSLNKESWQKVLDQFGLKDTGQSLEEVRNYIIEAFRTGAAKTIREGIKYLNEKQITPTQEKLGITYIQRPEDVKKETSTTETQLYKIFKNAGYQGTEDEFYTNFMPDVDRNEQIALTKAGTGSGFSTTSTDFSDPFAALSSVESFFAPTKTTSTTKESDTSTTSTSSYFKLFDEDEALQKSKSGSDILGEFTSMFKGFM